MRGKNKLVLHIAVVSVTGMLALTATFPQPEIIQTEGTFQPAEYGAAGVMTALLPDEQLNGILKQEVTIEKNNVAIVAASASDGESDTKEKTAKGTKDTEKEKTAKDTEKEKTAKGTEKEKTTKDTKNTVNEKEADSDTKEKKSKETKKNIETENETGKKNIESKVSNNKKSKKLSAVEKKWAKKLMADVDDYLNVRKSASVDSEVQGKLRKGDVATIVKAGKTWTKIKSGSVTGYVKNKYCVSGTEAYKLANKICKTYATVQADGLRIRKKANKNALVLDAAEENDKLVVNTKAKVKDGWVAVKYDDKNAYVSEEYVEIALGLGTAITIEEEQAQIAAERKAEQESAQAASSSVSSNNTEVSQSSASVVSNDDLTLLSAIIYCEAGGESYAGQVAVGAVVMNRVKSGSYPSTISGVVYQSGQFSPVANGSLARALSNGSYQNCISAAREALAGADNTGGAKNFHRVNGDAGLVIGHHVFF